MEIRKLNTVNREFYVNYHVLSVSGNMRILTALGCLAIIGVSYAELRLLQATFRHGDRAPDEGYASIYPNDPYVNETWYPEGWGGLTNGGKISAYGLGEFLREEYGKWLGEIYTKELVRIRSSSIDRTIMTAQLVASALFPPKNIQRWNPALDWQPIPVWSVPLKEDFLFFSLSICSNHKKTLAEIKATDERLLQREKNLREFHEFVSKNIGTKSTQDKIFIVYHQLYGQLSHGVKLPEWTNGIFPKGELEHVAAFSYIIQSYNNELKKLNGGLWIREWLINVDNYMNKTRRECHKAFLYSGHEVNIAAILVALNVFEPHLPSYASAVLFELHEEDDDFCVKVIYRNNGVVQEIFVPGCETLCCQLDTFRNLFYDIIVKDPMSSC